jgi:acetyltransferase-like isoleucine patch superfamily enzyme
MPGKSFAENRGTQLAMLFLNLLPPLHAAGTLACLFLPLAWPWKIAAAFAFLYLIPIIPARILRESLRKSPPEISVGSPDFLKWWACFQFQVLFLRFPATEEIIRLIPGAYSLWLRAWGSRIGKFTYWAPRTCILDRGFLDIGDNVVFGAGVKLNPHVIENGNLLLAPVEIGDRAAIGGYSLLTAGTAISPGDECRAFLISPPFSKWKDNKRIREKP